MEKYKNTLKIRQWMLLLLAAVASGLGIYDTFWASEEIKSSILFEFQCGLTTALGILAVIWIIRYSKVLRSEKELQIQYNKENDERMKIIRAKAGMPMLLISSIVMIVAGLIASYINTDVSYTLIATAICQMMIACIAKLIYRKII